MLVDCDHRCNRKRKFAHDRIGRCLGYLYAEADPDRNILCTITNSTDENQWGMENVEFCVMVCYLSIC